LEKQLRLRVHSTLLDLARSGKIVRERFEDVFLYLSIRTDRAQAQLVRRREEAGDNAQDILPDGTVIEVFMPISLSSLVPIVIGPTIAKNHKLSFRQMEPLVSMSW
jgi:hypothetical protein